MLHVTLEKSYMNIRFLHVHHVCVCTGDKYSKKHSETAKTLNSRCNLYDKLHVLFYYFCNMYDINTLNVLMSYKLHVSLLLCNLSYKLQKSGEVDGILS